MVTNPECAPCAMSHAVLEDLITKCPGNFKLKIIFKDDPASKERMSTRVAKIIMSEPEQEKRPELLSTWYSKKDKKNLNGWIASEYEDKSSDIRLEEHSAWCTANQINTPTFFVNDKRLPQEFNIADLAYHLEYSLGELSLHKTEWLAIPRLTLSAFIQNLKPKGLYRDHRYILKASSICFQHSMCTRDNQYICNGTHSLCTPLFHLS